MNWEWLDGIPYFVVTVEWASGKRRKKEYGQGMVSSWNTPYVKPDHAAGACRKSTGHVPAQEALSAFLHPNIHSQCKAKGENPSKSPPSQHSTQNSPDITTLMVHTLPSHGRGSRITFFINQFTASLNTSPPKKEICEGKTAVSSPLRDPSTYQALSVDKTPNIMFLIFFFDYKS